jgi:hypothetical protein
VNPAPTGAARPPAGSVALPGWVTALHAVSRALGVAAAGLILISIGVICQMVFVRAVLQQSSIWQTEFVTFALVAATFIGAPYILLTRGHVAVDVLPRHAPPELAATALAQGIRLCCIDEEADLAFTRRTLLLAADQAPFLRRARRVKLAGLVR